MRIAVIGGGYVGLVSAACFAEFGIEVAVVEAQAERLAALQKGEIPIYEPGLDTLVAGNIAAGRLSFGSDIAAAVAGAEAIFIAVGTPPRNGDGHADLTYVFAAAEQVARAMTGYAVIVTKSTVPVGTGRRIAELVSRLRPELDFDVASNPEFLREGSAIGDFMRPDRVVIGLDAEAAPGGGAGAGDHAPAVSAALPDRGADPVHQPGELGAHQVRRQLVPGDEDQLHQRDGRPLRAGRRRRARAGARHRPRQPHRLEVPACRPRLWRLVLPQGHAGADADRAGGRRLVAPGRGHGAGERGAQGQHGGAHHVGLRGLVRGKRVAVLGLTFKPETDDMRDAPSIPIVHRLVENGAEVRAFDPAGMEAARPHLPPRGVAYCTDALDAAAGADVLLVLTEWNEFRALSPSRLRALMRGRVVIDLRNIYDPAAMAGAGMAYSSIGRPRSHPVQKLRPDRHRTRPDGLMG